MGLADIVATTDPADWKSKRGNPCSVGQLERQLTGEDLDALRSVFSDQGYTNNQVLDLIARAAKKEEDPDIKLAMQNVAPTQVPKHRNGKCRCYQ